MGKTGSYTSPAEAAGRTPPENRFLRLLFNIERTTLGPVAGLAEEFVTREQGLDQTPYWEAMKSGFNQAKTFDRIIENPWLAFSLNVGADPATWIPGSWIVKGTKGATKILGVKKVAHAVKSIERIDRLDSWFGKRFRGPNYEIFKRNPEEVRNALAQRNIDFDNFVGQFVQDVSEGITKLSLTEEESTKVFRLLQTAPPGKTLAESLGKIPAEFIDEYNKLSPSGKTAYRIGWEARRGNELVLASRAMRGMNVYEALQERVRSQYKTFVSNPAKAKANEMELDEILRSTGVETVGEVVDILSPAKTIDRIIEITPDIPKAYKGLATLAVRAGTRKIFRAAVRNLPDKSLEKSIAKNIERDQAILEFKAIHKMVKDEHGNAADFVLAEQIANSPKSRASILFRKFTGMKTRPTPKFQKSAPGNLAVKPQIPTYEQLQRLMARIPLSTPYGGLDDFYAAIRRTTDIGDESLDEALKLIGKAMPQELKATMSIKEIQRLRGELLDMSSPEKERVLQDMWDGLNKNRFKGLPLNIVRQADIERIAKINVNEVEIRLAEALQVEGIAAARAVANDNYHRWLFEWLHKKGLLMSVNGFKDLKQRTAYFKKLKEILPEEEFGARAREGFSEVTAHPIFKGFVIPSSLAHDINGFTTIAGDPTKIESFFALWAKYQGLWKAWQLAVFPSYHVRNAISNTWNNYLAGVTEPHWYLRAHEIQHKMRWVNYVKGKFGGGFSPEELELIKDLRAGVVGGEYAGELRNILDKGNPFRSAFSPRNIAKPNVFHEKGFAFGTYLENNARIAHYLKMRHGKKMSHLDALKSVNKYLFDWRRGLTQFEDKYLRNFAMPFYAWTRFNMPLQLEMLAMQPGKFTAALKFKDAVERQWGGPDPDTQFQADWFKQAFNVRVRYSAATGAYEYFFLDSWLPAADINKLLSGQTSRDAFIQLLSPAAKIPFEIWFNYNLFKKRPIAQYAGQRIPLHLPGGKQLDVDARGEFLLRQVRLVNEVDRFLDQSMDLSDDARWARVFVGRSYPYNPDEQRGWWLYKLNTQIRALKGFEARAIEKGNEGEADRIGKKLEELEELQNYYQ